MKIYISHSRLFDFQQELYAPLRASELNARAQIILPHEKSEAVYDSKTELQTTQWVIAEVSYPSIGVGIEIGWASMYGVPIIAVQKKDMPRSSSADHLATHYLEYNDSADLIQQLSHIIPVV